MTSHAASGIIKLTWRSIPSTSEDSEEVIRLTESLTTAVANSYEADTAIIRKEPHATTAVKDPTMAPSIKCEPTQMHITGSASKKGQRVGYAFHYYTDEEKRKILPYTDENPNAEVWEMKSAKNTGFVFHGEEEIHDSE